jgi:hypothetical protein
MNPIMFRGNEFKRHYQEILQEVEHERLFGQNPSKVVVKVLSGLGGILIALVVAVMWLG